MVRGNALFSFTYFIAFLLFADGASLVRIRLITKVQDSCCLLLANKHHSYLCTDSEIYLLALLLPWVLPSAIMAIFTSSSFLHPKPVLCTHEASSSSSVPCLKYSRHLVITYSGSCFYFSTAKLRQAVLLQISLHYLLHKNSGSLPHFSPGL